MFRTPRLHVSSFVELSFKSDHIARRDSTRQDCFVELNRVGRCDHFKDSTQQNSFVELIRVGRCGRALIAIEINTSKLWNESANIRENRS